MRLNDHRGELASMFFDSAVDVCCKPQENFWECKGQFSTRCEVIEQDWLAPMQGVDRGAGLLASTTENAAPSPPVGVGNDYASNPHRMCHSAHVEATSGSRSHQIPRAGIMQAPARVFKVRQLLALFLYEPAPHRVARI